jgi:hypothetical protein
MRLAARAALAEHRTLGVLWRRMTSGALELVYRAEPSAR